jgi:hypothetical protein
LVRSDSVTHTFPNFGGHAVYTVLDQFRGGMSQSECTWTTNRTIKKKERTPIASALFPVWGDFIRRKADVSNSWKSVPETGVFTDDILVNWIPIRGNLSRKDAENKWRFPNNIMVTGGNHVTILTCTPHEWLVSVNRERPASITDNTYELRVTDSVRDTSYDKIQLGLYYSITTR